MAVIITVPPRSVLGARRVAPNPQPSPIETVLQVQVIPVERAAQMVRALFPHLHIRKDMRANALVVVVSQADVDAMRTIVQGIDVKIPMQPAIRLRRTGYSSGTPHPQRSRGYGNGLR